MVTSAKGVNGGCCFDYGNAESDNHDDVSASLGTRPPRPPQRARVCVYRCRWYVSAAVPARQPRNHKHFAQLSRPRPRLTLHTPPRVPS